MGAPVSLCGVPVHEPLGTGRAPRPAPELGVSDSSQALNEAATPLSAGMVKFAPGGHRLWVGGWAISCSRTPGV